MYTVLKDSREKEGHGWFFPASEVCNGTEVTKLKTGDYTIKGMEDFFIIERKGSVGELAQNIVQKRFIRQLELMSKLPHSFLVLEFNLDDVYCFPFNSGIPVNLWPKIKIRGEFIVKRILEMQIYYNIKVLFAGNCGSNIAEAIFKRMIKCTKNKKD